MPQCLTPDRQIGVTFVDLMVAVSILAIVLTLGVPGFRGMIARAKMVTAANGLIAHLYYARSTAVERGATVTVCPSSDGATCASSGSALWSDGYIVQVDSPASLLRRVDAAEMSGITVKKNGSSAGVTFAADGSATGYACTFTICDIDDATNKRAVVVSNVGRVRVSDYASDGKALTCP